MVTVSISISIETEDWILSLTLILLLCNGVKCLQFGGDILVLLKFLIP
jgi:hypothetical protein